MPFYKHFTQMENPSIARMQVVRPFFPRRKLEALVRPLDEFNANRQRHLRRNLKAYKDSIFPGEASPAVLETKGREIRQHFAGDKISKLGRHLLESFCIRHDSMVEARDKELERVSKMLNEATIFQLIPMAWKKVMLKEISPETRDLNTQFFSMSCLVYRKRIYPCLIGAHVPGRTTYAMEPHIFYISQSNRYRRENIRTLFVHIARYFLIELRHLRLSTITQMDEEDEIRWGLREVDESGLPIAPPLGVDICCSFTHEHLEAFELSHLPPEAIGCHATALLAEDEGYLYGHLQVHVNPSPHQNKFDPMLFHVALGPYGTVEDIFVILRGLVEDYKRPNHSPWFGLDVGRLFQNRGLAIRPHDDWSHPKVIPPNTYLSKITWERIFCVGNQIQVDLVELDDPNRPPLLVHDLPFPKDLCIGEPRDPVSTVPCERMFDLGQIQDGGWSDVRAERTPYFTWNRIDLVQFRPQNYLDEDLFLRRDQEAQLLFDVPDTEMYELDG